jgi:hypothetical protein
MIFVAHAEVDKTILERLMQFPIYFRIDSGCCFALMLSAVLHQNSALQRLEIGL